MQTFDQSASAVHSSYLLPDTSVDDAEGLCEQSVRFYEAVWDCRLSSAEGITQKALSDLPLIVGGLSPSAVIFWYDADTLKQLFVLEFVKTSI